MQGIFQQPAKSDASGYTWHHANDFDPTTGKTIMQLVKTSSHVESFPHSGSADQFAKHFGVEYDSQEAIVVSQEKGWLKGTAPKGCQGDRMKQITFQKCSRALETSDLRNLESLIKASLPEDFRSHYMNYNGGLPSLDWFPARSGREPIWIQEFLPIESTVTKPDVSINSLYLSMTKKNILQGSALPFALDPGANFFCLDLKNGRVFYHVNDVFDPALEANKNLQKAQRTLTSSFADFIALLVSEDEAYS